MHQTGDRIELDDGEVGTIVAVGDDGTLEVRTGTGIVITSALDDSGAAPTPCV